MTNRSMRLSISVTCSEVHISYQQYIYDGHSEIITIIAIFVYPSTRLLKCDGPEQMYLQVYARMNKRKRFTCVATWISRGHEANPSLTYPYTWLHHHIQHLVEVEELQQPIDESSNSLFLFL